MKRIWEFCVGLAVGLGALVWPDFCEGRNLDGPKAVKAGTLAVFESKIAGAFAFYPNEPGIWAGGADGRTLYFASNVKGRYCVLFASAQDGELTIETLEFENGDGEPEPAPIPEPEPEPVKTDLSRLTPEELEAADWGFSSVIAHIVNGRLTTAAGARATFKYAVGLKLKTQSEAFGDVLDGWTDRTDWTSIQTIRASFEEFRKEIEEAKK